MGDYQILLCRPTLPLAFNYHVLAVCCILNLAGQKTEMVLNEYIPFVGDWCDVTNKEFAPNGK